jgi:hypothetical protein
MDVNVVATETQSTETAPSIRDEMVAALESDSAETESQDSVETEKSEGQEAKASDESENHDESSEEDDGSDETETPEAQNKPTRRQRMKARLLAQVDEAKQQANEFARERDEAVKIANLFKIRTEALQRKFNDFIAKAQQGEADFSPMEAENFRLRQVQMEQDFARQYDQNMAKLAQENAVKQRVSEHSQTLSNEALNLSTKFIGVKDKGFAREVLQAYAAAIHINPEATLEQTAKIVFGMKNQNQDRAQLESNKSAPKTRTSTVTKGTTPQFKSITEEMEHFLSSRGK